MIVMAQAQYCQRCIQNHTAGSGVVCSCLCHNPPTIAETIV
jgi:hypothetical protein